MIYYRVAVWGSQSATWRWKSDPLTSLHPVLGLLNMYRGVPNEHIRVFLSTSSEQMEEMLCRANQGLLSTTITVDQLWDKHCIRWIEVKRLEVELGSGGDHDQPYTWSLPPSASHMLAWAKLRAGACVASLSRRQVQNSSVLLRFGGRPKPRTERKRRIPWRRTLFGPVVVSLASH